MLYTSEPCAATEASEVARLETLASFDLLDTPSEPHLDSIVRTAADQAEAAASTITLIDRDRQWFKARVGIDVPETGLDASICNVAMRTPGDVFVVPDAAVDPRFAHMPGVADGMGIRFYAGTPLVARDGRALGMLCVIDTEARSDATEDERRTLALLARRTMAAFELRRDLLAAKAYAGDRQLLGEALTHLERASVALDLAGEGFGVAQLDPVISRVEALLA